MDTDDITSNEFYSETGMIDSKLLKQLKTEEGISPSLLKRIIQFERYYGTA